MNRGKAKDISGSRKSKDDKIDVECPPPGGRGCCKCAANDRTQDGTDAPTASNKGHIKAAFLWRRHGQEVIQGAKVDSAASYAGDNATNDQSTHGWSSSTDN